MVAARQNDYWTVEEYLAFIHDSEYKYEYIDGQIYLMAGGSPRHNQIIFNLNTTLGGQIFSKPCIGYGTDQAVRITKERFSFPDLTIACGESKFDPLDKKVLINPTLIIEVLSTGTEGYDRGEKAAAYRENSNLKTLLFVTQYKAKIEVYERQSDGTWKFFEANGLEATFDLPSIGCTLSLAAVYNKVIFDPADVPKPGKPISRTTVEPDTDSAPHT